MVVNDYMVDTVLHKIKETMCIEKFDDAKISIDRDDKLPDYITLKKCCDINNMCH